MNYEEKYKDSLERARKVLNTPYTAGWDKMKELIEHLFPELAESEGERIRKMLLDMLTKWNNMAKENNVEKDIEDSGKAIEWLRDMKIDWDCEDEKILNALIKDYEANNPLYENHGVRMGEVLTWLKKLGPQAVMLPRWRRCSEQVQASLDTILNIRTTTSGDAYLIVDGYELKISQLQKLPKER